LTENLEILLLGDEKTVTLLEGDTVSGVLVVGRKSGRVCRLGDLGTDNLLERVDALAVGVESVHKMHDGRFEDA